MFTGIIEALGSLQEIHKEGNNIRFLIESPISHELKVDQSVSHDGVCLTVTAIDEGKHWVTAVHETLLKTQLSTWQKGRVINLERAMLLGDRLDGHIVQGHVDTVGVVKSITPQDGSTLFTFHFPEKFAALLIEKGSICVNGTSLTAFDIDNSSFHVAIIPYTFAHTNFQYLNVGDQVNLEFDVLGKYILRSKELGQ